MNTRDLELFHEVSKSLSFAAVAALRNCPSSTVSRGIAALEKELGIRLFQRTTRSMTLTEEGERFLPHARGILAACEEARDEVARLGSGPRGTLRLSASAAFGEHVLVPLLGEVRQRFPQLRIDLVLSDARKDLVTERIDLAIRHGGPPEPGLIARKLANVRYKLCAAPGFLARNAPIGQPQDLTEHRCLLYGVAGVQDTWRFRDKQNRETEIEVSGDLRFSSAGSLLAAAREGQGPALLADWLVRQDFEAGRLQQLCPDFGATPTVFESAIWLAYPSRSYIPTKTRAMIDYLVEKMA